MPGCMHRALYTPAEDTDSITQVLSSQQVPAWEGLARHSMAFPTAGTVALLEEAVCSTSGQGGLAHGSASQRPFSDRRPGLGRSQRSSRSNQKRYTLLARADARSQDFQRAGLDFQRAAKLRLDQLVNRVQGCDPHQTPHHRLDACNWHIQAVPRLDCGWDVPGSSILLVYAGCCSAVSFCASYVIQCSNKSQLPQSMQCIALSPEDLKLKPAGTLQDLAAFLLYPGMASRN